MPLLHLASSTVHDAPQQPSTALGPHLPLAGRAGWAPASSRWSAQSEWPKRHAECSGVLYTGKQTLSVQRCAICPVIEHTRPCDALTGIACGFPSSAGMTANDHGARQCFRIDRYRAEGSGAPGSRSVDHVGGQAHHPAWSVALTSASAAMSNATISAAPIADAMCSADHPCGNANVAQPDLSSSRHGLSQQRAPLDCYVGMACRRERRLHNCAAIHILRSPRVRRRRRRRVSTVGPEKRPRLL